MKDIIILYLIMALLLTLAPIWINNTSKKCKIMGKISCGMFAISFTLFMIKAIPILFN